jgi:hypothetical protein
MSAARELTTKARTIKKLARVVRVHLRAARGLRARAGADDFLCEAGRELDGEHRRLVEEGLCHRRRHWYPASSERRAGSVGAHSRLCGKKIAGGRKSPRARARRQLRRSL